MTLTHLHWYLLGCCRLFYHGYFGDPLYSCMISWTRLIKQEHWTFCYKTPTSDGENISNDCLAKQMRKKETLKRTEEHGDKKKYTIDSAPLSVIINLNSMCCSPNILCWCRPVCHFVPLHPKKHELDNPESLKEAFPEPEIPLVENSCQCVTTNNHVSTEKWWKVLSMNLCRHTFSIVGPSRK